MAVVNYHGRNLFSSQGSPRLRIGNVPQINPLRFVDDFFRQQREQQGSDAIIEALPHIFGEGTQGRTTAGPLNRQGSEEILQQGVNKLPNRNFNNQVNNRLSEALSERDRQLKFGEEVLPTDTESILRLGTNINGNSNNFSPQPSSQFSPSNQTSLGDIDFAKELGFSQQQDDNVTVPQRRIPPIEAQSPTNLTPARTSFDDSLERSLPDQNRQNVQSDFSFNQNNNQGIATDDLLERVKKAESNGNPNAVSPVGAKGLFQFMDSTFTEQANKLGFANPDPFNPQQSRIAARNYLNELGGKYNGDQAKALAAYNWGPRNVDKAIEKHGSKWMNHLPNETTNYLEKILGQNSPTLGLENTNSVSNARGSNPTLMDSVRNIMFQQVGAN